MIKPVLLMIIISLFLFQSASLSQVHDFDPRSSHTAQDQHSFFFSPFEIHGDFFTGTSVAISWADASPVMIRSLFPAASATGNRIYVQYNNIPDKSIVPYFSFGRYFTTAYPANSLRKYYSNTFKAVRPTIRAGYFGKPFSGEDRLSAGITIDVIRTQEPYFGRRSYGFWQITPFLRTATDSFSSIAQTEMDLNPLTSNISHTGLRSALSLSWDLTGRISLGTRFGWAGYSMDGSLSDFRNVVQPNSYTLSDTEHHNRRYRHYDAAAGIEFKPSELNRILLTAGFLTGSSDRDIDISYNHHVSSLNSGSTLSSSTTGRDVYYLAAAADQQLSRFFSASLLLTWQRGTGDLDEHTLSGNSSTYSTTQVNYLSKQTYTDTRIGWIDTREMKAGLTLIFDSRRLNLFTGLWLTDQYENFETRTILSSNYISIQFMDGEQTVNGSSTDYSSGNINRYELIRYEIPAGLGLTVFPWLDLNAAVSYKILKTDNPSENLFSHQGLPGIRFLSQGSSVDPVNFSSESTNYRTDYYFGLAIRPVSSIHIRAGAQPVYNSLVESSWMTSLSVEIVL